MHSLNSHCRVSHTFCFCFSLINKALHWCRLSENFQINCQNVKTYQKRNFVAQFEVPVSHTPRLGVVTWLCVQWLKINLIDPCAPTFRRIAPFVEKSEIEINYRWNFNPWHKMLFVNRPLNLGTEPRWESNTEAIDQMLGEIQTITALRTSALSTHLGMGEGGRGARTWTNIYPVEIFMILVLSLKG